LKKSILKDHCSVEKFCYENEFKKQTLSLIINGKSDPGLTNILRITHELGINIYDLIGEEPTGKMGQS